MRYRVRDFDSAFLVVSFMWLYTNSVPVFRWFAAVGVGGWGRYRPAGLPTGVLSGNLGRGACPMQDAHVIYCEPTRRRYGVGRGAPHIPRPVLHACAVGAYNYMAIGRRGMSLRQASRAAPVGKYADVLNDVIALYLRPSDRSLRIWAHCNPRCANRVGGPPLSFANDAP